MTDEQMIAALCQSARERNGQPYDLCDLDDLADNLFGPRVMSIDAILTAYRKLTEEEIGESV